MSSALRCRTSISTRPRPTTSCARSASRSASAIFWDAPDRAAGFDMAYETIIVETKGKVGIIRFNRPQALNALNAQLNADMTAAIDAFEADEAIGCVIITGSERAFAAGADIKEMSGKSHMDVYRQDFAASWERVSRMRKPVIAAVSGFALGGG